MTQGIKGVDGEIGIPPLVVANLQVKGEHPAILAPDFGIDWGETSHELCVTNAKGEEITRPSLAHTAAVIERVVHHARILQFGSDSNSMRAEAAAKRQQQELLINDSLPDNG